MIRRPWTPEDRAEVCRRWLILNNQHLPGFDARDFEGKTK